MSCPQFLRVEPSLYRSAMVVVRDPDTRNEYGVIQVDDRGNERPLVFRPTRTLPLDTATMRAIADYMERES